jgi:hypothetical protein
MIRDVPVLLSVPASARNEQPLALTMEEETILASLYKQYI